MDPLDLGPLILAPPQLPLFTLNPPHSAGRSARRGNAFQDWVIAYTLAGFWAGDEDFVVARIEAVEDLDVMLRVEGWWVERYSQIKSRQEGTGNWTLKGLEDEGVLSRFFNLYREFHERSVDQRRRIELVVALEGDLDKDLSEFKRPEGATSEAKAKLFRLLVLSHLVSMDASYKGAARAIGEWCARSGHNLFPEVAAGPGHPGRDEGLSAQVAIQTGKTKAAVTSDLREAAAVVGPLLEDFIKTLGFESRMGHLQEAVLARLTRGGDLGPDEAPAASDRLMKSIQQESILPGPTKIDRNVLSAWVGAPERTVLQSKPSLDEDTVHRGELLDNLAMVLRRESVVVAYGLPKTGKTQFISALVDHAGSSELYFWFTFSGESGDLDRLMKQLCIWFGQKTSVWQTKADVEAGRLQPAQLFDRLSKVPVDGAWIVFDDCHKSKDRNLFETIRNSIVKAWPNCRMILISEEKLPEMPDTAARYAPIGGLNPRESLEFVTTLGLDVSGALFEFATLAVQVNGHPVMLRAIVQELPKQPSKADLQALTKRLPTAESAQPFLAVLSTRFLSLARTSEQRAWLGRLSALSFSFTRSIAFALAGVEPKITITPADWLYLTSRMLDRSWVDHYTVPLLLRSVARSDIDVPTTNTLLLTAGRHVFKVSSSSPQIDFWDFNNAVVALILAGEVEEAAERFIRCFPSLMRLTSFEPVEILFMILNGEPIHQKIANPATRWILLQTEMALRQQDTKAAQGPKIMKLFKRMRGMLRAKSTLPSKNRFKAMFHAMVCASRIQDLSTKKSATPKEMQHAFAPLQRALRLAVSEGAWEHVSQFADLYNQAYMLAKNPDVEVLRSALVAGPSDQPAQFSPQALISLYSRYVLCMKLSGIALELVERHAADYLAKGLSDAYFACEHAASEILHDGQEKRAEARARIVDLLERRDELKLSQESVRRAELFVGDTYWHEKNYAMSADYYERVVKAKADVFDLAIYACQRHLDSLIFLKRFDTAARHAVAALRRRGPEISSADRVSLYSRLAYAYAEAGALMKATIACASMCKLAGSEESGELDAISTSVTGWVLYHVNYKDPIIPRSEVYIRDSAALSEPHTADQIKDWRASDPTRTKGIACVATLFELLGDLRRAESGFRTAIATADAVCAGEITDLEIAYYYRMRLARIQIKRAKLPEAANTLKAAHERAVQLPSMGGPSTEKRGVWAYQLLHNTDQGMKVCSDPDLLRLFELIEKQWNCDQEVLAWLRYREGEILFTRQLVQAGKRRLAEAENLARSANCSVLYWTILEQKLFRDPQQFYSNPFDWLRDGLGFALVLATNDAHKDYRNSFADDVDKFSRARPKPPFTRITDSIDRLKIHWKVDAFSVAVYAVWKVAKGELIIASSLNAVESYLKKSATFLTPDDF